MKANPFDEAARKCTEAMRELCEYYSPTMDYIPPNESILKTIANHHADLKATFELLVELANLVDCGDDVMEASSGRINAILNDIKVIDAMKSFNRAIERISEVKSDRYEDRHDIHEASFGVDDEGDR